MSLSRAAALLVYLLLPLCLVFARRAGAQDTPQNLSPLQLALVAEQALTDAIAKAEPSVVALARVKRSNRLEIDPTDSDFIPNQYATGVVIGAEGLILTNHHVLGDPQECEYFVYHNKKPYTARLKAEDPWLDLAVLKIDAGNLKPIKFGDASKLTKGQFVVALGNPLAIARDGDVCASRGIISNLSRPAPPVASTSDELPLDKPSLHHYGTLIHTDTRLHLGNSGGALINLRGEMIGLTTALAAKTGYETAGGFAIPVNDVFKKAVEKLKEGRQPDYGFLGVGLKQLSVAERHKGKLGARVAKVLRGTPASVAGLEFEDVITHINGRPIHNKDDGFRLLGEIQAGDEALLTIERGGSALRSGRTLRRKVALGKKHVFADRPIYSEASPQTWRGMTVDYATALPILERFAHLLDERGCVLIANVQEDSPAWKAGLRPRMFISHVDDDRIATPEEFFQAVSDETGAVSLRTTASAGRGEEHIVSP